MQLAMTFHDLMLSLGEEMFRVRKDTRLYDKMKVFSVDTSSIVFFKDIKEET